MAAICILAAMLLFIAGFFLHLLGGESLGAFLILLAFLVVFGAWLAILLSGRFDWMPGDK